METVNAKQVLSNLYGLMMEINLHQEDAQVLAELELEPDVNLQIHLQKIKQLSAKLRAHSIKMKFQNAMVQLSELKLKGIDELKRLIKPNEQEQLIPLFRKFEELTEEDEKSLFEDQELLNFIELLKDRLNVETEH